MMFYGVIALIITMFAMFGYFAWLAYHDPANLFKRRRGDDEGDSE